MSESEERKQSRETIVKLLLDNGTDIDTGGGKYGSPLATAIRFRKVRIVQLLLDRDADVNMHGGKYGCPLATAMALGDQKIVQLLIDRGAVQHAQ